MQALKNQINHCKICFKEINDCSFYSLTHKSNILCEDCFNTLKVKFINFKIGSIKALSIYEYDDTLKKLIYTFKGCYDYELKDVFLTRYVNYLKFKYQGYVIVPVPSSKIDDEKRGFNHVVEIYRSLGLPIYSLLRKISKEKQSSKSKKKRLNIENALISDNIEKLYGKKVLIVDDIYTTGATMFKAIELIKSGRPKIIKVLVIAKTIDLDKRQKMNIP